jgi:hypothetical protein
MRLQQAGNAETGIMNTHRFVINMFAILFSAAVLTGQESDVPFVVNQLFDHSQPETLGLDYAAGAETFTVFTPGGDDNKYNHGVVLFPFRGMLYAQWQSSAVDEDADDTQVFYSRSADGKNWQKPVAMTRKWEGGIKTSGGWWSDGETLVAYINVWPVSNGEPAKGYTEYLTSFDGTSWEPARQVTDLDGYPVRGIIEQDVHALPGGRLITAFHIQPKLIAIPYYTDDPLGISGWQAGEMKKLTFSDGTGRAIEPGWFYRKDNAVVMVFRDQGSSYMKLASVSHDFGLTWTTPQLVDTPDSRSKQSAGNLPDGTAYMINNPSGNRERFPLTITLSNDGKVFDRAYLLRSGGDDLQPMRFSGLYKRKGYSYPKSVIWGDYLYVSYATNKEDVEVTKIPVESLLR